MNRDIRKPPSASRNRMHTAYLNRRRCRGTYYKPHVLTYISGLADKLGCSFSATVNSLLDKVLEQNINGSVETLALEVKRLRLIEEETGLRQTLKVILRSGAYLPEYAEKLFTGGRKSRQVSLIREGRMPLPAVASVKEQEVIARILARREKVVEELIEVEDRLLPEERFQFGLDEKGWSLVTKPRRVVAGGRR